MKICYLLALFFVVACGPKPEVAEEAVSPTNVAHSEMTNSSVKPAMVADCNLTLGFDAWEPYQYADVGGRVAGLDIELVYGVAKAIGCDISYKQGTWVELLSLLKDGEIDMLLGASKTPAREEFALFSEPYRIEEFSLYIRNADMVRSNYTSLTQFVESGSRIGVVADYLYGEEVAKLLDDPEKSKYFVNAIMGELNVARLLDQDIDGFLEDSFVGASLIRRKALSEYIVPQGIKVQTGNAYVMFSKESISPEQLALFNGELARVKASQTYQDLLNKYSY